jgi:hypothetical protein
MLEKNYDPKEPDQIAGLLGWCRLFWRHLGGWALLMVGVILLLVVNRGWLAPAGAPWIPSLGEMLDGGVVRAGLGVRQRVGGLAGLRCLRKSGPLFHFWPNLLGER